MNFLYGLFSIIGLLGIIAVPVGVLGIVFCAFMKKDKTIPLVIMLSGVFLFLLAGEMIPKVMPEDVEATSATTSQQSSSSEEKSTTRPAKNYSNVQVHEKTESYSSADPTTTSSSEDSSLRNDIEEISNDDNKFSDMKVEGNTVIIQLADNDESKEDYIYKYYTKTVADLLQRLKTENFDQVIISKTSNFMDIKGNESERLSISTLYGKSDISAINFENWIDQVFIDPYLVFDNAEAYYIDLNLYEDISSDYLGGIDNSKTVENEIYDNYGYPN